MPLASTTLLKIIHFFLTANNFEKIFKHVPYDFIASEVNFFFHQQKTF